MAASEPEKKKLIVGVDYGTTYSGVSYVWSNSAGIEDVILLTRWGNLEVADGRYGYEKQVPSKIAYDPRTTWGYNTERGALAYCWTKLLLDRYAEASDFDDTEIREVEGPGLMQTPPGKTPEDVVSDYLTQLYAHVMAHLAREISVALLQVTPIEFWFTMPALWSVRAENATRDAAVRAGFGSRTGDTIHLIREPEAAAIACLNDLIKNGENPLVKAGNGVLVCDCGGGTVDLASYKINISYPKLSLDQACISEGGKCGSTTIDRALHKLLRNRFGNAFTDLPLAKRGAGSKLMTQFESAKRDFGVSQYSRTYRFHLKLPGVADSDWYDPDDDEVLLTTEDMQELFDPVVKKIIGLLEQQIVATRSESSLIINTIILVGGFGESAYLFSKLKEWCPESVDLINPAKSWEAICVGAAVRGLEGPIVVKKKSKLHLGSVVARAFREGVDDESESFTHPYDGVKKIGGYMDWMIARGEIITPETVKRTGYWRAWLEGSEKKFTVTLYQSSVAVPPEKLSHHSVKRVGDIEVDLATVDFEVFDCKQLDTPYSWRKTKLYQVVFEVVTVLEDDLGYMHFRAVVQGKKVGEVRLAFGNEEAS